MVAYSFKKQFCEPIENRTKRQTLRGVGKRRHARVGDALQLYTGMRTKHCRKIIDDQPCTGIGECIFTFAKGEIVNIEVDGQIVDDLDEFARADGFEDVSDMGDFWADSHGTGSYTGRSVPLVLVKW